MTSKSIDQPTRRLNIVMIQHFPIPNNPKRHPNIPMAAKPVVAKSSLLAIPCLKIVLTVMAPWLNAYATKVIQHLV